MPLRALRASLDASSCGVDDSALAHISKLGKLQRLNIAHCFWEYSALEQFEQALPNCHVQTCDGEEGYRGDELENEIISKRVDLDLRWVRRGYCF